MSKAKGEKDGKAVKMRFSYALDAHADVDLKRCIDGLTRAKARDMAPFSGFLKKLNAELKGIKDAEIVDVPNIPLFVCPPQQTANLQVEGKPYVPFDGKAYE